MKRHLRISIYVFLLTTAAGSIFFLLKPDLAVHWLADYKAEILRHYPRSMTQAGEFFHIAANNLKVSLLVCLMGLIPLFSSRSLRPHLQCHPFMPDLYRRVDSS
jgi:uncharacterized membrane protein SpoIIM required for sporulation